MTEPLEIERKFLIHMPEEALLRRCIVQWDIEQTYLLAQPGISARVRRRMGPCEQFFYTEKERISDCSCVEREREIGAQEYRVLLQRRDPARVTLRKRRYVLPWQDLDFEIDVYPFWQHIAVLEVELEREEQSFTLPPELRVLREVSGDWRLKNAALAGSVPSEEELLAEIEKDAPFSLQGPADCATIYGNEARKRQ